MKKKKLILLVVLAIIAIISHFFSGKNKTTESVRQKQQDNFPVTGSLGNYDVKMSSDSLKQNAHAPVHYYTLALSWSPAFCQKQRRNNNGKIPSHLEYQCANGQQFGWVIHGLWPQNANARQISDHPRYCRGDLPMVDENIIKQYMSESPGAKLLQGEWEKHGACAFEQADDYFAKQKELFKRLTLPHTEMSSKALFQWMRENNPQLRNIYFGSAGKDELYICYDKQWQPMSCPKR